MKRSCVFTLVTLVAAVVFLLCSCIGLHVYSQEGYKVLRTSLPSILLNSFQHRVNEARGMIADLLANRDLPGNVHACLRAVNTLLNPVQTQQFSIQVCIEAIKSAQKC